MGGGKLGSHDPSSSGWLWSGWEGYGGRRVGSEGQRVREVLEEPQLRGPASPELSAWEHFASTQHPPLLPSCG